jgi:hypothetical protein
VPDELRQPARSHQLAASPERATISRATGMLLAFLGLAAIEKVAPLIAIAPK